MDFSLDFEYTPEATEFAREVRQWLDENVPDDMGSPTEPAKVTYEQWKRRRELGRKLGKKGWLYPGYPREYGGGGLDRDRRLVIAMELSKRGLGLPPYDDAGGMMGIPAILACGTEEQKRRFLPPMLTGEAATWELFTEPEAGTDEANQKTNALRAVREQDYFIINGGKIFVGALYPPPEQFLLLTRSDLQAPRHENLAMFICPANLPGISIVPLDLFVPINGCKYQVFFDDVRLPESQLIGGDRDGWKVASAALMVEHGGGRAPSEGGRRRGKRNVWLPRHIAAERFFAQCKNNPHVVRRLRDNPHLLDCVVDTYIGAQVERLFLIRNHGGKAGPHGGAQQLVYSKMLASKLAACIARVLGPYTLTDDSEWAPDEGILEVAQRGAMAFAPGGTPEAMRIIMSRGLGIGR